MPEDSILTAQPSSHRRRRRRFTSAEEPTCGRPRAGSANCRPCSAVEQVHVRWIDAESDRAAGDRTLPGAQTRNRARGVSSAGPLPSPSPLVAWPERLVAFSPIRARGARNDPWIISSSPSGSTTSIWKSSDGSPSVAGRKLPGRSPTNTSPSATPGRSMTKSAAVIRPAAATPRSRFIGGVPMNPATNRFAGRS